MKLKTQLDEVAIILRLETELSACERRIFAILVGQEKDIITTAEMNQGGLIRHHVQRSGRSRSLRIEHSGMTATYLKRLIEKGFMKKIKRGLYTFADMDMVNTLRMRWSGGSQ